MNAAQAKQLHLKDLLMRIGNEPAREDRGEYWYISPFRQEQEASFKITRDGKGWYDHGAGQGGNILDFVIQYPYPPFHTVSDIAGALRALSDLYGQASQMSKKDAAQRELWDANTNDAGRAQKRDPESSLAVEQPVLQVTKIQPLQHRALIHYLRQRGIDGVTAGRYLQEAYYSLRGKEFFALAFANDSGGYELRSANFQGCNAIKDITSLHQDAAWQGGAVALFEGFMDFLSALVHTQKAAPALPVIILNSAAMRHRALAVIENRGFSDVHLYFDHDKTGKALTGWFQGQLRDCTVTDQSDLYAGYKDFNDWLQDKRRATAINR